MQMTKRRNKSESISEELRRGILDGKYPPGSLLSSNIQLAADFDVAPLTANRALNKLVAEGLVIRKRGHGSYVAERPLSSSKPVYRIGIMETGNYLNPAQIAAMKTFSESMIQHIGRLGHQAQIIPYADICAGADSERELRKMNGFLLNSSCYDDKTEKLLSSLEVPIILYLRDWLDNAPFHQVGSDFTLGMREAVRLLIEQDCRELLVFSEAHRNGQARRQAFLQELSKANTSITIKEEAFFKERTIQGLEVYKKGLEMAEKIQDSSIFCTSDIMSFHLLQALIDKGLKLQRDYHLISVDNLESEDFLPFGKPVLTSIDYPRRKIALKAVELLLFLIENQDDCRHIVSVPTCLVRR